MSLKGKIIQRTALVFLCLGLSTFLVGKSLVNLPSAALEENVDGDKYPEMPLLDRSKLPQYALNLDMKDNTIETIFDDMDDKNYDPLKDYYATSNLLNLSELIDFQLSAQYVDKRITRGAFNIYPLDHIKHNYNEAESIDIMLWHDRINDRHIATILGAKNTNLEIMREGWHIITGLDEPQADKDIRNILNAWKNEYQDLVVAGWSRGARQAVDFGKTTGTPVVMFDAFLPLGYEYKDAKILDVKSSDWFDTDQRAQNRYRINLDTNNSHLIDHISDSLRVMQASTANNPELKYYDIKVYGWGITKTIKSTNSQTFKPS